MLFFIVGGDYDSDGSANGAVDGRGIVEAANAVVVVANYRLGILGCAPPLLLRPREERIDSGGLVALSLATRMCWQVSRIDRTARTLS